MIQWRVKGTFLDFYSMVEEQNGCLSGSAARRAVSVDTGYSLMTELCKNMSNDDVSPVVRHRSSWPIDGTKLQQLKESRNSCSQCIVESAPLLNITDTKTQQISEADPKIPLTAATDLSDKMHDTDSQNGTESRYAKRHKSKGSKHAGLATGMAEETATTVMIRHIACRYMQEDAVAFLDVVGLQWKYDFVYVPLNSSKNANLGYMFVNFLKPEHVNECKQLLHGQSFGESRTLKKCEVTLAHVQGYASISRHFHKKAVMKRQYAPLFVSQLKERTDQ